MTGKTLHLFRHGQTDWNLNRRLQGGTDIPLNDTGREQARGLRSFFERHPPDLFISSPLARARESLLLATGADHGRLIVREDLREVTLGSAEGKQLHEIHAEHGEERWKRWAMALPGHEDFALPGAEPARASNARLVTELKRIFREHDFRHAAVCSHGLLIRRFLQFLDPREEERAVPNMFLLSLVYDAETDRLRAID